MIIGPRRLASLAALVALCTATGALPASARVDRAASSCTVKLGVVYGAANGSTAANEKGSGTDVKSASDQQIEDMNQVAFDDINDNGGIGGCQVEPVYVTTSTTSNDFSGQAQQACAKLAQDEKVFAVLGSSLPDGLTTPCFVKAGIPVIGPGILVDYSAAPKYLYGISTLSSNRMGSLLPVWQSQGALKKGTNAGIVWVDDPAGAQRRLVNDIWKPQLKKMGVTVTDFSLPFANGNNQISTSVAQMGSAVLKFKNANVTEVLLVDAIPAFLFPISANSQDYRPTLLVSDNGYSAAGLSMVIPPETFPHVKSIGWSRANWNATVTKNPAVKSNAATEHCDSIYKGVNLPAQQQGRAPYDICDNLAFLQQALKGKKATVSNLDAGVNSLGTSFVSATALGPVKFGKGRHDGTVMVQHFAIDQSKVVEPQGGLVTLKDG